MVQELAVPLLADVGGYIAQRRRRSARRRRQHRPCADGRRWLAWLDLAQPLEVLLPAGAGSAQHGVEGSVSAGGVQLDVEDVEITLGAGAGFARQRAVRR